MVEVLSHLEDEVLRFRGIGELRKTLQLDGLALSSRMIVRGAPPQQCTPPKG